MFGHRHNIWACDTLDSDETERDSIYYVSSYLIVMTNMYDYRSTAPWPLHKDPNGRSAQAKGIKLTDNLCSRQNQKTLDPASSARMVWNSTDTIYSDGCVLKAATRWWIEVAILYKATVKSLKRSPTTRSGTHKAYLASLMFFVIMIRQIWQNNIIIITLKFWNGYCLKIHARILAKLWKAVPVISATVMPAFAAAGRSMWSDPIPAVRANFKFFAFSTLSGVRNAGWNGVEINCSISNIHCHWSWNQLQHK